MQTDLELLLRFSGIPHKRDIIARIQAASSKMDNRLPPSIPFLGRGVDQQRPRYVHRPYRPGLMGEKSREATAMAKFNRRRQRMQDLLSRSQGSADAA